MEFQYEFFHFIYTFTYMRLKGIAMSLLSVCAFTPAIAVAGEMPTNTPEKEQVQTGICVLTAKSLTPKQEKVYLWPQSMFREH